MDSTPTKITHASSRKHGQPNPTLLSTPPPRIPQHSPSSSSSNTVYSDRFIPSRTGSNFALFELAHSTSSPSPSSEGSGAPSRYGSSGAYAAALRSVLFGVDDGGVCTPGRGCGTEESTSGSSSRTPSGNRNIFRYKTEVGVRERLGVGFQDDEPLCGIIKTPTKVPRKVPQSPYKVLDAPALRDDFYLNLVDWSSNNMLAVGLGNCVYLWNACSSKVTKLCDLGVNNSVCSVGWAHKGNHLAVGTNSGEVQIWDASKCRNIRTMEGHHLRVGTLAWNSSLLSSGGRDRVILHHDIRAPDDCIGKLMGHKSEVCGLKWSCDNRKLASGGNDNKLLVWNQHSTQPLLKYSEHTAAVKAIAWSPHSYGILASGGGTADRCIRFWNTSKNTRLNCIDTGSQVCNIGWSKNVNELVSTHGYSQNQIVVWRYPSMSKLATLTGHTYRVLHLATSPDGQTIVTGAGDETLRFWNAFPSARSQISARDVGSTSLGRSHIR